MDTHVEKKIETFFSQYPLKHFKKGQIIIYGGEEPSGVFHLSKGKVRQYDINEKGNEVVVNIFKPPAFFPMSWAINKSYNYYFFETAGEVTLRQAPATDVVDFLKENPDILFNLVSRLYSGTDGLQRRMAHLMGGTARSRVIFELNTEAARFGEVQKDGSVIVPINERELAERTGLSRETVNREISKLVSKKLITYKNRKVQITNHSKLKLEIGNGL